MNFKKQLYEGLLTKNPVLAQLLGLCSVLAITTSLFNGLGMGLSVTIILICSNVLISALRKVIPSQIRIAAYIVIIAGFVTIVDLLLQAFLPELAESLGVFIPLIVVNCIVLGRAEAFASKNGVLASAVDGLCQGIGYTVALVIMCVIRELLGAGTFGGGLLNGGEGYVIIPEGYPAMQMVMPVGGFLTLGFVRRRQNNGRIYAVYIGNSPFCDPYRELYPGKILRHLPLYGRFQEDRYGAWYGYGSYLCYGPCLRCLLGGGRLSAAALGTWLYADGGIYFSDHIHRAGGGNVPEKECACPL